MSTNKSSQLSRAIVEMAEDQRRLGLLDDAAFRKITLRRLGRDALPGDELSISVEN
jgi:putative transcriptional regulator